MKKQILLFLFLGTVLLSFFLSFYKLGQVPFGLNQDESAIGYNAFSILKTGRDEHGIFLPLYFKSFNDYKLPGYIYSTVLSEIFFGVNSFAVRFPSAFFGVLTVIALFFLVKEMTNNVVHALLSSFLLTINPWHIFFSRLALEVNMATSFLVLESLFFLLAIKKNRLYFYFLSILSLGVSLYTYNVTRLVAPVLLLLLIILYHKQFFAQSKKRIGFLAFIFTVILIPFVLTLFHKSGLSYQQNVLITGGDAEAQMIAFRSYLIGIPHILTSLLFSRYVLIAWQYLQNVSASLSTSFFFSAAGVHSGDVGVGNVGMFYPIEFFTMIVGIYAIIKHKIKNLYFFTGWGVLVFLLVSISATVPTGTRNYPVIIPLVIFSAYGVIHILTNVKQRYIKLFIPSVVLVLCLFLYSFLYFQVSYYFRFPIVYAASWRYEDKPLSLYLAQVGPSYKHIILDKSSNFIYTSLVFYQKYSPTKYQEDAVYEPDQLFTTVSKLDTYEFRDINWESDLKTPNTLIVTTKDHLPANVPIIKTFYYPTKPIVLSIQNTIYQYPVTDVAYVVVASKP